MGNKKIDNLYAALMLIEILIEKGFNQPIHLFQYCEKCKIAHLTNGAIFTTI